MSSKVDEVIAAWAAPLERKLAEDPEGVLRLRPKPATPAAVRAVAKEPGFSR